MYQKILVPVDGSELAECVLPHVASIARGCGAQSVIFLYVVEPLSTRAQYAMTGEDMKRIYGENKAAAEDYLRKLVGRIKYDGIAVRTEVLTGIPGEDIAEYAAKNGVDLIAIATHGRSGITRWAWGSVADRVLRSVCVPVLMVRAPGCVPGI